MHSQEIFALKQELTNMQRDLRETRSQRGALAEALADFIPIEGQRQFRDRVEQANLVQRALDFTRAEPAAALQAHPVSSRIDSHHERAVG